MQSVTNKTHLFLSYLESKALLECRSRKAFLNWQQRAVKRHLSKMSKNYPLLEEYLSSSKQGRWIDLPVMDRLFVQEHYADLNILGLSYAELANASELKAAKYEADEADKAVKADAFGSGSRPGYAIGVSSGTSGQVGFFITSPKERAIWAGNILAKILHTPLYKKSRIALFLRRNSELYQRVSSKQILFKYFDLSRDIELNLKELESFNPDVLVAPPSLLCAISRIYLAGKIELSLKQIVSCAEILDKADRKAIESAFGKILSEIYQCTEGFLAFSCRMGFMHFCEDLVFLEFEAIAGTKNKYLPIITDFRRESQILLRYRLSDIVSLSEQEIRLTDAEQKLAQQAPRQRNLGQQTLKQQAYKQLSCKSRELEKEDSEQASCPCGSVFRRLERVDGRLDDAVRLLPKASDLSSAPLLLPSELADCILKTISSGRYKLCQTKRNSIKLFLEKDYLNAPAIIDRIKEDIESLCLSRSCLPLNIEFENYQLQTNYAIKQRKVSVERAFLNEMEELEKEK